jgi:hypothetical protein
MEHKAGLYGFGGAERRAKATDMGCSTFGFSRVARIHFNGVFLVMN